MSILVMVVEGKNDYEDFVTIETFEFQREAVEFINNINNKHQGKYWKTASIVAAGERLELTGEFNPRYQLS